MMKNRHVTKFVAAASVSAAFFLGTSFGGTPAIAAGAFFKDKAIKLTVRSKPSGNYNYYGRLIARHIGRHIAGNPNIVVVNLNGGGGIVAANYLASRAKRDGTEFAILSSSIAIAQRLGYKGIQYDVRKFIPLGNPADEVFVLVTKKDFPVNNLKELRAYKKQVRFSATGLGSGASQMMAAMKADGFPIRIILGYGGTSEKLLALIRDEVDGTGSGLDSMGNAKGVTQNKLKVIGHLGQLDDPIMANSTDMVKAMSSKLRPLMELMAAPQVAARPFFLPPEVPADRVALLRTAFKKAVDDPKLVAEVKKAGMPLRYVSPQQMEKLYDSALKVPDDIVKKVAIRE